jgi:hypothetical protein
MACFPIGPDLVQPVPVRLRFFARAVSQSGSRWPLEVASLSLRSAMVAGIVGRKSGLFLEADS